MIEWLLLGSCLGYRLLVLPSNGIMICWSDWSVITIFLYDVTVVAVFCLLHPIGMRLRVDASQLDRYQVRDTRVELPAFEQRGSQARRCLRTESRLGSYTRPIPCMQGLRGIYARAYGLRISLHKNRLCAISCLVMRFGIYQTFRSQVVRCQACDRRVGHCLERNPDKAMPTCSALYTDVNKPEPV